MMGMMPYLLVQSRSNINIRDVIFASGNELEPSGMRNNCKLQATLDDISSGSLTYGFFNEMKVCTTLNFGSQLAPQAFRGSH